MQVDELRAEHLCYISRAMIEIAQNLKDSEAVNLFNEKFLIKLQN